MSDSQPFINTVYGCLDRVALENLRDSYDTTTLLRVVDELAELLGEVIGEEGWRDRMLRLHGMAHTVINDAGFAGTANETLPELASEITGQMREAIARLESWIQRIEPLEELAARD